MNGEMLLFVTFAFLLGAGTVLAWIRLVDRKKTPATPHQPPLDVNALGIAAKLMLIETLPIGAIIVDGAGIIMAITHAARQMLGIPSDQNISGMALSDLFAPWPELANLEEPVEFSIDKGNNESASYEVRSWNMPEQQDNDTERWCAITIQDITARERVTMTLRHTYDKLAEAKEYVEAILNNNNDAIVVTYEDFTLDQANPAFYAMFGYELDEMYGHHLLELFEADDHTAVKQALEAIAAGGRTARLEVAAHSNNTEVTHVDVMISAINTRHGDRTGYVCSLRDVTDRIQAAVRREKLIEDLDSFAHMVAHDLKGPLSNIRNATELMLTSDSPLSEFDIEVLQIITSTTMKMASIIDELLLLAGVRRLDEVPAEALDMEPLIKHVRRRLAYLIEQNRAIITGPTYWPPGLGYGPWVEEVWANYISNAIKYGGDPPHITLGARVEDNGKVRYWVRDNGEGIWPEQQARLFTQFTQLDRVRAKGHGRGLSIVKRIVETLGGEVDVESIPGKGSTFSFTLPAPIEETPPINNRHKQDL